MSNNCKIDLMPASAPSPLWIAVTTASTINLPTQACATGNPAPINVQAIMPNDEAGCACQTNMKARRMLTAASLIFTLWVLYHSRKFAGRLTVEEGGGMCMCMREMIARRARGKY